MYPRIDTLPPLAVINSFGDVSKYPWYKKWIMGLAYDAIKVAQKDKYPNSDRVDSVHVVCRIPTGATPDNYILDVTYPQALIHAAVLDEGQKYRIYKWEGSDLLQELLTSPDQKKRIVGQNVLRAAYLTATRFHGQEYDELQLVSIGAIRVLQKVVEAVIKKYLPEPIGGWVSGTIQNLLSYQVFGFAKWRTVCSAGTLAVLITAYKKFREYEAELTAWGYTIPVRPLGDIGKGGQWIESCMPADFENSSTFNELKLAQGQLGRVTT